LLTELDKSPQVIVAGACIIIGISLFTRGVFVVKPLFVIGCSVSIGCLAYNECLELIGKSCSYVFAGLLGFATLKLWHCVYRGFLFFTGCSVGGCTCVLLGIGFGNKYDGGLLAVTVLSALLVGLSFVRFQEIYWRLITPIAGGLLAAATLRYFLAVQFLENQERALWTDFAKDLHSTGWSSLLGAMFWTSWAVSTCAGWYMQLGPLFGIPQQDLLPDGVWDKLVDTLPVLFLTQEKPGKLVTPTKIQAEVFEPLLQPDAQDTDIEDKPVPTCSWFRMSTDEAVDLPQQSDHDFRPEIALLVAVASVFLLNFLLMSQPLLFLGHAVLMSLAFLPLATAGMVTYSSQTLLLPRLFSPRVDGLLPRHFTHGAFNGLVLVCAVVGYLCIYGSHEKTGASQVGMQAGDLLRRKVHVWNGYVVLLMLAFQASSGVVKLYSTVAKREKRLKFHSYFGRIVYSLAAVNQCLAYTFPGLVPAWAQPVLAGMLLITVGITLFCLTRESERRLSPRV